MANHVANNVFGAVLFLSYIAAALALTSIIIYDLYKLYERGKHLDGPENPDRITKKRRKMQVLVASSVLSFSMLSYHMLNFLIRSYQMWSQAHCVSLPHSLLSLRSISELYSNVAGLQIWRWSKSSTLFLDFAETICDEPRRFWWTAQALVYSMAWNMYMSLRGMFHTARRKSSLY